MYRKYCSSACQALEDVMGSIIDERHSAEFMLQTTDTNSKSAHLRPDAFWFVSFLALATSAPLLPPGS